ncbi:C-terminal domain of homeodomain 1-domain-containing protein [Collybia nuda]|uniref:C-terminal domain of homeodomain 1-domain-containing protein n=1 Tax=Collybia nuda TaxID=64659 RepID=A0A9P6C869_9AGAR|nr:C-terminal domain of homeodomain 1-domain-containing protein [Collybia nuda]
MDSAVDAPFVQRLSEADSLLDAISDHVSLTKFNNYWLPLVDDLQTAISTETLHTSTILTAYALSDRVSVVIHTFLDLDILSEKLMTSFSLEATSILSPEEISPINVQPLTLKPAISTLPSSLPSYIQPAYQWLLNNLHNPYPSVPVRDQLARKTRSPRKDIDAWFIETRRRIGWNTLRREKFSNKRADIVAAATKFFCTDPANCGPPKPIDHATSVSFISIENQAKELYSEKFSESDLALKLDAVVKNMTPKRKIQVKADKHHRQKQEKNEDFERAASSYPSPSCSSSLSLAPSSPLSLTEDDSDVAPIPPQTRKRRFSSLERQGPNDDHIKRPKNNTQSPTFTTGLLSPASSVHDSPRRSNENEVAITSLSVDILGIPPSRKRRRHLSDLAETGAHKRPYTVVRPPSLSTTTDTRMDEWYCQGLDLSNHELEPTDTAPFEIEVYDVSKFIDENELTNMIEYPSPRIEDLTSLLFMDTPSLPFDYDELFSSGAFTQDFKLSEPAQGGDPCNFPGSSSTKGFIPEIFDFSQAQNSAVHDFDEAQTTNTISAYTNPPCSPGWMFSVTTSPSSDSGDKFQDLLNTFPQSTNSTLAMNVPSAEFQQSAIHKSQSHIFNRDDRAAKQQKLLEIKEVARQLEAELAAT